MVRYRNKSPSHLIERGLRIPMEREIRLTNHIVLDVAARYDEVGEEEKIKGKEYPFYVSTITWKEK